MWDQGLDESLLDGDSLPSSARSVPRRRDVYLFANDPLTGEANTPGSSKPITQRAALAQGDTAAEGAIYDVVDDVHGSESVNPLTRRSSSNIRKNSLGRQNSTGSEGDLNRFDSMPVPDSRDDIEVAEHVEKQEQFAVKKAMLNNWHQTREQLDASIASLRFFDNDTDPGMRLRRRDGTFGQIMRCLRAVAKALFTAKKPIKPISLAVPPPRHITMDDLDDIADLEAPPLSKPLLVLRMETKNTFVRDAITTREKRKKVFFSTAESQAVFLQNVKTADDDIRQSSVAPVLPKVEEEETKTKNWCFVEDIAWRVFDADQGLYIPNYPGTATAWDDLKRYLSWLKSCYHALLGVIFIYLFELPWWCLHGEGTIWQFMGRTGDGHSSKLNQHDLKQLSPFSLSGILLDTSDPRVCPQGIDLSGVPVLHPLYTSIGQFTCYAIFITKWAHGELYREHFGKYKQFCKRSLFPRLERGCAFFGLFEGFFAGMLFSMHLWNLRPTYDGSGDMMTASEYVTMFYTFFFNLLQSRISHMCVIGLTFAMPFMTKVTYCVLCTAIEVQRVVAVFCICIVFFAWSTVSLLQTTDQKSCVAFFYMGTTANYPAETINLFDMKHWTGFIFFSFMLLAALVFTNLMLATVYSEYQSRLSEVVKMEQKGKLRSLKAAWEAVTTVTGDSAGVSVGEFRMILDALAELESEYQITREMIPVVFEILDEQQDGRLDTFEFFELCSALHFTIWVVRRDSALIRWMQPTPHAPFAGFWYKLLRQLQKLVLLERMDMFFNRVLILNAGLIIMQSSDSVFGIPTKYIFPPKWSIPVDFTFSSIYMVEVAIKLACVSWGEYWKSRLINRFDFVVSVSLFLSSCCAVIVHKYYGDNDDDSGPAAAVSVPVVGVQSETIAFLHNVNRQLSVLRVLRLFRILVKSKEFQRLLVCISRMILACGDIMCLLLVSMFFFVSVGQLIWGGKLGFNSADEFNRRYADSAPQTSAGQPWTYDPELRTYNFNDVFMGLFTMFSMFFNNALVDFVNAQNIAVVWPWPLKQMLDPIVGTGLVFQVVVWFTQSTFMFNLYVAFSIDCLRAIDVTNFKSGSRYTTDNFKELQKRLFEKGFILYKEEGRAVQEQIHTELLGAAKSTAADL